MNNSFLTVAYKQGYVHTWLTSTGKEKAQAQYGDQLREFPTVTGCKRWITRLMRIDSSFPEPTLKDDCWLCRWTENGDVFIQDYAGLTWFLPYPDDIKSAVLMSDMPIANKELI